MPTALTELVNDWTRWLNATLASPSLPLHARRSPHDAGNEHDASITKASIHINTHYTKEIPALVGLISLGSPHTRDSGDDDDDILSNEVFQDQIRPLRSSGPFFCFVAQGRSKLKFYYCEDGSAGYDEVSHELCASPGHPESMERGEGELRMRIREVLMNGISANSALMGRTRLGRGV